MSVERLWVWIGWVLVVGCTIGWPVSAITWARDEPQTVLALSFLALTLAGGGILVTAQAQEKLLREIRTVLEQGDASPS